MYSEHAIKFLGKTVAVVVRTPQDCTGRIGDKEAVCYEDLLRLRKENAWELRWVSKLGFYENRTTHATVSDAKRYALDELTSVMSNGERTK